MPKFKEGDRVQVRARAAQGKEAQEGRYAPHLANAVGTVLKVYTPQEIAVDLDLESLPDAIRERHAEQQTRMHERWLNSLSEEARNRLTDEEKSFHLRYVALLAEDDLLPLKASTSPRASAKPAAATPAKTESTAPKPTAKTKQSAAHAPKAEPTPRATAKSVPTKPAKRPTPEQLEQLEEQYLKTRRRKG
jgi:pyruvate/2-oxoglutarate dehydrogenase complex dihydrolipoamide acyltransferase (E2) component